MKKTKLNKKDRSNSPPLTFPNITPRRGSLPGDFNSPRTPRFPLHSPTTPSLSPTPHHLTFSPTLPDFAEVGEVLDDLLNRGKGFVKQDSDLNGIDPTAENLSRKLQDKEKLLANKERQLEQLETEKTQLLERESEWEQTKINHRQVKSELTQREREIKQLTSELKQTNDDLYQIDLENKRLKQLGSQERVEKQRLVRQLEQEKTENSKLRVSQSELNRNFLEKVSELKKIRRISSQEKEQWQQIIDQQKEKYEAEKKEREEKYNQTLNNLRTFQLTTDIPAKFKNTHKPTLSTGSLPTSHSNSPRNSYLKDGNLYFELTSPTVKKGNIFAPSLVNSPLNDSDIDPFESEASESKKKRHSNSPAFAPPFSPEIETSPACEELWTTVANVETETENNQALLEQIEQLKEQLAHSETAYQIVVEEHNKEITGLRSTNQRQLAELQEFDKKEVAWRSKEQSLTEELEEMKYKLAEAETKTKRLEKSEEKSKFWLKKQKKEIEELEKQQDQESKKSHETVASLKELNQKTKEITERNRALIEIIKKS